MFLKLSEMVSRREILGLYKQILRTGQKWVSKSGSPEISKKEQNYILNEAKSVFRQNKYLEDKQEIEKCFQEATTRLNIAIHYKIPYPRPVNVPPMTFVKMKNKKLK